MNDSHPFRCVLQSTIFWMILFTILLFLAMTYGARPALHALGVLFGWLGGPGLDGTDL